MGSPEEDRPRAREVRAVYDEIGEHFAQTRDRPWPEVERFVDEAPDCDRALDVGCGNGRHATLLARRAEAVLALDASRTVLRTARDRVSGRVALLAGDAARLPVASASIDIALSIATIHHLGTRAARRRSLDELARVLVPGGRGLVSAWATTHDRFEGADASEGFDTTVDWTLPDGKTVPRFYHIYAPPEFRADLAASDLGVDRTFEAAGNCYGVVRG